jgi:hypothetical protein
MRSRIERPAVLASGLRPYRLTFLKMSCLALTMASVIGVAKLAPRATARVAWVVGAPEAERAAVLGDERE